MPNQGTAVINAVVSGADVRKIKNVGYLIIAGQKRHRRTKAEMKETKADHK